MIERLRGTLKLTLGAVAETIGNDGRLVCITSAGLVCAVSNTISKVGVGAKTASIRLTIDIRAAELNSLGKHVVDACLLSTLSVRCAKGVVLKTYTTLRQRAECLGNGNTDDRGGSNEVLHDDCG